MKMRGFENYLHENIFIIFIGSSVKPSLSEDSWYKFKKSYIFHIISVIKLRYSVFAVICDPCWGVYSYYRRGLQALMRIWSLFIIVHV